MSLEIRPAQMRLLEGLLDEAERFVIVGAAALLHHVRLPRVTNDIDLAHRRPRRTDRSLRIASGCPKSKGARLAIEPRRRARPMARVRREVENSR
jgi:hypothetical protein